MDIRELTEQILAAMEADENTGICLQCGNEQGGCEPDARKRKCDACGALAVYGAEECVLMLGGF